MKKCPKCSIMHSEMWNTCVVCHAPLKKENILKKIFAQGKQNDDYLFPMVESIINQAHSIFLYLDRDLKPIMCNKAIEHITGYSREEIFDQDWLKLLFKNHPSRIEIFKAMITSCLDSIKSRPYEGAITKKNGEQCVLSWRSAAVTDASGSANGIICTAQDITEYKRSEEHVSVQSDRLRNILASVKDYALITTNLEGKITYYGVGATELFKWKEDMTLKDILLIFDEIDRKDKQDSIKKFIDKSGRFEQEVSLLSADQQEFPATLTVSALLDENNEKTGYVYIIRDITERKMMERQMVQSEKMAAIGQLAAGVAHEINNPLLVVLGRLDMLTMEDEKLPPKADQTMKTIKNQAERMRDIVDRLLSYSRQRSTRVDPLDVNDVLRTISPLVAYHEEFKMITWNEELAKSLPKVRADFNQLQELFLNLTLNACQAMHEGGVLSVTSRDTKKGFVEVTVGDTGPGIRKENLDKLFTPFFTTKDKGTGLGLSICHNIVDGHGGKIEVESELNKGTTFKVKLPAQKS